MMLAQEHLRNFGEVGEWLIRQLADAKVSYPLFLTHIGKQFQIGYLQSQTVIKNTGEVGEWLKPTVC